MRLRFTQPSAQCWVSNRRTQTGSEFLQTEHGLHGDEECRHVESLEEHFSRLLPVLARVQRSLCEQHRMLGKVKKKPKKKKHRVSGVATSSCVEVREPERSSPPRRMSAAAPWSKRTARSAPCHSSRSRCHAPSGTAPTAGPCAPDGRRRGRVYYSLKMWYSHMLWSDGKKRAADAVRRSCDNYLEKTKQKINTQPKKTNKPCIQNKKLYWSCRAITSCSSSSESRAAGPPEAARDEQLKHGHTSHPSSPSIAIIRLLNTWHLRALTH